jgi:hypothetical protein
MIKNSELYRLVSLNRYSRLVQALTPPSTSFFDKSVWSMETGAKLS